LAARNATPLDLIRIKPGLETGQTSVQPGNAVTNLLRSKLLSLFDCQAFHGLPGVDTNLDPVVTIDRILEQEKDLRQLSLESSLRVKKLIE
jgi:hypothetical protein